MNKNESKAYDDRLNILESILDECRNEIAFMRETLADEIKKESEITNVN